MPNVRQLYFWTEKKHNAKCIYSTAEATATGQAVSQPISTLAPVEESLLQLQTPAAQVGPVEHFHLKYKSL